MQEREPDSFLIPHLDDSESECLVLTPPSNQKALEWLAVLGAANLEYQLEKEKGHWRIQISRDKQEIAMHQLVEFERECGYWPPKLDLGYSDTEGFSISSLYAGVYLFCFFLVTGPYDSGVFWFNQGQGSAEKIISGEYWRVVTALTLHSDFSHVLGNAFCCVFLGGSVCLIFGYGIGWLLILICGASANLINSLLHSSTYGYVGASTAVFAAIGILGALRFTQLFQNRNAFPTRTYLPLLSVFAILSILGTGPKADILGHFMGAVCGIIIGFLCFKWKDYKEKSGIQVCCITVCISIILLSWNCALEKVGGN